MSRMFLKYIKGSTEIKLTDKNMLVEPVNKLEDLKGWEKRMRELRVAYAIASFRIYKEDNYKTKTVYSLYINSKDPNNPFSIKDSSKEEVVGNDDIF